MVWTTKLMVADLMRIDYDLYLRAQALHNKVTKKEKEKVGIFFLSHNFSLENFIMIER